MMPRRSLRSSSNTVTPQKINTSTIIDTHSSKRARSTPAKSQYFQNYSSEEQSDLSEASSAAAADETSGYEDEDVSLSEPSSGSDAGTEGYESDERSRPKKKLKRIAPIPNKAIANSVSNEKEVGGAEKVVKGRELWRHGVKTGLGPGTQIIIDKPKARTAGSIPYRDNTIHPNTMLFLKELADNNDREWLKMHDPNYRMSLKDFNSFVESIQEKIIELDGTIPELPVKDIVFRIYRDVRFSPDQTPYKTYFSAAWSRTGRKGPFAAYYVQIKPTGSFVGGGLWMPEAQPLAALRRDVDRRPHRIKHVLQNPKLRKHFFGAVGADEKEVVTAFVTQNAENALKTKPKGYDAEHENIALLRLRNYTVGRKLDDKEILGERGITRIVELLSCLVPFITYLNSVVMPDDPEEEEEQERQEDDDEEEENDSNRSG